MSSYSPVYLSRVGLFGVSDQVLCLDFVRNPEDILSLNEVHLLQTSSRSFLPAMICLSLDSRLLRVFLFSCISVSVRFFRVSD